MIKITFWFSPGLNDPAIVTDFCFLFPTQYLTCIVLLESKFIDCNKDKFFWSLFHGCFCASCTDGVIWIQLASNPSAHGHEGLVWLFTPNVQHSRALFESKLKISSKFRILGASSMEEEEGQEEDWMFGQSQREVFKVIQMIMLASWNIRGLNDSSMLSEVRHLVHSQNFSCIVLNMFSPSSKALHLHPTKLCTFIPSYEFATVFWDPIFDDPNTVATVATVTTLATVPDVDPFAVYDPYGTGAVEDPNFDDPNAFSTVATVPIGSSSVSLVTNFSSSASSPGFGREDSSPSSSPPIRQLPGCPDGLFQRNLSFNPND